MHTKGISSVGTTEVTDRESLQEAAYTLSSGFEIFFAIKFPLYRNSNFLCTEIHIAIYNWVDCT